MIDRPKTQREIFATFLAQSDEDKAELAAFAKTKVKRYGVHATYTLSVYEVLALCWAADAVFEDHPQVLPRPSSAAPTADPERAGSEL